MASSFPQSRNAANLISFEEAKPSAGLCGSFSRSEPIMRRRSSFTLPAESSLGLIASTAIMKKLATMLTLAVLWLTLAPVRADDVPHLDFVRALRARNFSDLALDYLERM